MLNLCSSQQSRKTHKTPNIKIIPKLHVLGRQVRQMEHVYKGYRSLSLQIIDPKYTTIQGSRDANGKRVIISQSASQRFERLSDRIEVLILSELEEFLAEKESLISTVFISTHCLPSTTDLVISTLTSMPRKTPKPPLDWLVPQRFWRSLVCSSYQLASWPAISQRKSTIFKTLSLQRIIGTRLLLSLASLSWLYSSSVGYWCTSRKLWTRGRSKYLSSSRVCSWWEGRKQIE
jgi:hypothetical protein